MHVVSAHHAADGHAPCFGLVALLTGMVVFARAGDFHNGGVAAGWIVKVIVDLCVVPIGVGVHLAPYVAACQKVLSEAGLTFRLHPNGTAIEGEWAPVFTAIEACHGALHAMGCPRIFTTVTINTRTDRQQSLDDKLDSVRALL
jgi:uncharacterized protein (TIGR00106 family)